MFVKMLTAMAGDSFSYDHGAVVEVANKIGRAWIAAGLAEETKPTDILEAEADKQAGVAREAIAKLKAAGRDIETHKADLSVATGQVGSLTAQLAESNSTIQALSAEVENLKAGWAEDKEAKLSALEELEALRLSKEALEAEVASLKADPMSQEPQ